MNTSTWFRACLGSLLLAAAADGLADYQYDSQFGGFGTEPGKFDSPRGVAVLSDGRLVTTEGELGSERVQICSLQGACTAWGSFGTESGQFDKPRGATVSSTDRIFIADRGNDRIQDCNDSGVCTAFGNTGSAPGEFESPRGVAMTADDRIIVTDTDNDRIQICTAQGVCGGFGSSGSALGRFSSPSGVAVDGEGRIIIADRGNNRIQICTEAGSCSAFGSAGSALGQFDSPAGVAVDSNDRIVIVDRFNDRVQICTDQGECSAFGSTGSGNGQFNLPWGVAVDAQDRIIVADLMNHRIQIFADNAPPPPVTIDSFTALPATIEEGEVTTLAWTVSNATECTASGGTVAWSGAVIDPAGGSLEIQISTPGSYTFTLQCGDGNSSDSADAAVTVTAIPPVTIDSFTALPATIEEGETTTLAWTVSNATECTPTGGTAAWAGASIDPVSGSLQLTIDTAGEYLFVLTCSNGASNSDERSVAVTVTETAVTITINPGIADAWYNPETGGQGFFLAVYADLGTVFASWFTYDVFRPDESVTAILGEPGHRWVTAYGPFSGNTAVLDIELTTSGVFDDPSHPTEQTVIGTLTFVFHDCASATVTYDFPGLGLSRSFPIQRLSNDKVAMCEEMSGP